VATTIAELQAVVTADTTQGDKSLKGFHKNLDDTKDHSDKASGGVLGFTKNIAGIAAGVGVANLVSAGFGMIRDTASDMIQSAMDANKGIAQTNAVLASTHGVSGQTAQSIAALADQFQDLEGVDDDVTRSAANMLLTFTNIKGDVFPGATQTALDMAAALGGSAKDSAMMLGKALNEPAKAAGILGRAGVQLTDDEQKAIDTALKHNDVAKAQSIILGELKTQFGGQAKAVGDAAGPMGKLNLIWQDVGKSIGNMLIPALQQAATVAIGVINFFQTGGPPAKALAIIIGGILVTAVAAYAVSMASAAIATIAATWPILLIIAAVGLLVAGIILLVQHWSQVTAFLQGVWAAAVRGVQVGLQLLGQFFSNLGTTIHNALMGAAQAILSWTLGVIARFQEAKAQADAKIAEMVAAVINRIRGAVGGVISAAGAIKDGFLNALAALPGKLADLATNAINHMISAILGMAGKVGNAISGLFSHFHLPGFAEGGIAPGGLAMVGEHGPEVVALPAGARVYPSGTGPSLGGGVAASASGGTISITIPVYLAGRKVAEVLLPDMVNEIRRATGGKA
jgi:hypothetical protein